MYSGMLTFTDNQFVETIAAADYFNMAPLKHELDEKVKYSVSPSNVLSWQKVMRS